MRELLRGKGTDPSAIHDGWTCEASPYILEEQYIRHRGNLIVTKFPWVALNHIYTTISYAGGSWTALIAYLYSTMGFTKFKVLSGRHGNIIEKTNNTAFDRNFYLEDYRTSQQIYEGTAEINSDDRTFGKMKFPGGVVKVKVVDTGTFGEENHWQVATLKMHARNSLRDEEILILPWCYSFFACNAMHGPKLDLFFKVEKNVSNSPLMQGLHQPIYHGFERTDHMLNNNNGNMFNSPYSMTFQNQQIIPVKNRARTDWAWVDRL
ncbi:hypothetical protein [Marinibactrum halimedae]|uniref:Uncharacterized protein n=1 Tax=Marinibactrum halimedae TaxID=1444977 RepID=A0AA37T4E2_9GAMM|nr:hypothetical protein [Marinibactrum halimedae]MCD9457754.1 hypothetical protein [Marinibactrum halimedae]GLS24872.1 hypothetical protein GCM10007877_05860 [Marinibactrum halimedae]